MTIRYIDIVHHTHTDFGYTDHPIRARNLHKKYVGQAVDHVLGTKDLAVPFAWTCEVFLPVLDWWGEADEVSRARMLEAVGTGKFEIGGMPFNVTTFMNADEWDFIRTWLPEELLKDWRIKSAKQNDVNGLYTAGLQKMMDMGVDNLWIGPNTYNALPPIPTPGAFNWIMPDGRKLFVWMNASYCDGFFMFNKNWRKGPVPDSTDLKYRAPREGDVFRTDDASMEKAFDICKANIAMIEGFEEADSNLERDGFTQNRIYGGYPYETLCVSLTNQWRIDNDPPFLPVRDFVEKWNEMDLLPKLRLSTVTEALTRLKDEAGSDIPEYCGEWPDWWANGMAAAPVELSATRYAKRIFSAAKAPVFGEMNADDTMVAKEALFNLCMYDEHSFGAWSSVSEPSGFSSRSAKTEKDVFAYRGLNAARVLLDQRARRLEAVEEEGVFLINPSDRPFKGYIEFPAHCLRGSYTYFENADSAAKGCIPIEFLPGPDNFMRPENPESLGEDDDTATFAGATSNGNARVWACLKPQSVVRYIPRDGELPEKACGQAFMPVVETDEYGWPSSICFDIVSGAGLSGEFGGFFSVTTDEFAPRWIFNDIFNAEPAEKRREMADKLLKYEYAHSFGKAVITETAYEQIYNQTFSHPSLVRGRRVLVISKQEKKAMLKISINRRSDPKPEILYTALQIAPKGITPVISNAGGFFTPGKDQLPGSCMDYYSIDGTVAYYDGEDEGGEGRVWQIGSRDAAIVSFGSPNIGQRIDRLPDEINRSLFMLFNNVWNTNFAADEHGAMEFVFDILCGDLTAGAAAGAAIEPVVLINLKEQTT